MQLNRSSLRDQVRDWLVGKIGIGDLAPGQRVMEEKVAEELHVSPIPVREAIRELVALRVLESAPNRGAWVRIVSSEETIEALQVRAALEPLAVRLAGPGLAKSCPSLRKIARATIQAASRRDFKTYQKYNQQFHRSIALSAGSSVLLRMWDSLAYEVGARSVIAAIPHTDPKEVAQEHESVVDAIAAGDVMRACTLLEAHTLGLIDRIRREHEDDHVAHTANA